MRHLLRTAPLLLAAAVASAGGAPKAADDRKADEGRKARGAALYAACIRCHGETGDEIGYANILTLVGIGDRISDAEIAARSGAFVGKDFRGEDADAIVAHLKALKGRHGYERPGLLVETHWLIEKHTAADRVRILDVRPADDYRKAHIPNAVHVDLGKWADPPTAEEFAKAMGAAAVNDDAFVVICDGRGGPDAAYLWWLFRRFGRPRVAILNGGWEKWRAEGTVGTRVPEFKPAKFTAVPPAPAAPKVRIAVDGYKWADALTPANPSEFRPAADLAKLPLSLEAAKAGAAELVGGNLREACHAAFVLSLLGKPADVAERPKP